MLRLILPIIFLLAPISSLANEVVTSFEEFPTVIERAGVTFEGILYDADDVEKIIQTKIDNDLLLAQNTKYVIQLETLGDVYTAKENVLISTIQNRDEVILIAEEKAKRTWWEKHDGEIMLAVGAGIVSSVVIALNSDK